MKLEQSQFKRNLESVEQMQASTADDSQTHKKLTISNTMFEIIYAIFSQMFDKIYFKNLTIFTQMSNNSYAVDNFYSIVLFCPNLII